ncbi:MAG: hypothetical protein Q4G59_12500, partial [Planctomycetia bacterium]|nr:hypothetical protein [Planctomycetia bacterium]
FAVCGYDGVVRFYQFDQTEKCFKPVYVVSQLTIASFLKELPKEEPATDTKKAPASTEADKKPKTPEQIKAKAALDALVKQYQEEEKEDDLSAFDAILGQVEAVTASLEYSSLLPGYKYCTNALVLSDDGKTLYVGSSEEVHAYDMDAIRARVAQLPTIWKNIDIEQLTGLRYIPGQGLQYINKNYLMPPK